MRALPLVHNSNVKNLNQKVEAERKRMENVRDTLFSKLIDSLLPKSARLPGQLARAGLAPDIVHRPSIDPAIQVRSRKFLRRAWNVV